jgi:hypothetical protein
MALLRCVDCGGKVSDKATACPSCGCPTAQSVAAGVEPLRSPDGQPVNWVYDGPLVGSCPACQVETEFAMISAKEAVAILGQDANELGQGNAKRGFFAAIWSDLATLLRGGKVALFYFCTKCQTRFHVCRNCMRPNRYHAGREQACDHCHHPMMT